MTKTRNTKRRIVAGAAASGVLAAATLFGSVAPAEAVWQPWCKHFNYHFICLNT